MADGETREELNEEETERMDSLLERAGNAVGGLPPSPFVIAWETRWEVLKHSLFELQDGQVIEKPAFAAYQELWALKRSKSLPAPPDGPAWSLDAMETACWRIHENLGVIKKNAGNPGKNLRHAWDILEAANWKLDIRSVLELRLMLSGLALASFSVGQASVPPGGLVKLWRDYPPYSNPIAGRTMSRYMRADAPRYQSDDQIQAALYHLRSGLALAEQASFIHPVLALEALRGIEQEAKQFRQKAEALVKSDFGLKRKENPLHSTERENIMRLCSQNQAASGDWSTEDAKNKAAERVRDRMRLDDTPVDISDITRYSRDRLRDMKAPEDILLAAQEELLA